jgi:hypothetical protein
MVQSHVSPTTTAAASGDSVDEHAAAEHVDACVGVDRGCADRDRDRDGGTLLSTHVYDEQSTSISRHDERNNNPQESERSDGEGDGTVRTMTSAAPSFVSVSQLTQADIYHTTYHAAYSSHQHQHQQQQQLQNPTAVHHLPSADAMQTIGAAAAAAGSCPSSLDKDKLERLVQVQSFSLRV